MRWNTRKFPIQGEACRDIECLRELQRKEQALKQKEKELCKKDKTLKRKITKFNKRKKNKAKLDLRAASKLRDARKKLLLTLDTKEKVQKCDNRTCKKYKTHMLNDKQTKKKKRDTCSPVQYFNDLLNRECECSAKGKKSRNEERDSCLKIFGRPMTCKYQCKNSDHNRSCRRPEKCKESYWDRAAGDCYLMSMRRPPQVWLYNRFPRFYPQYLSARQQCKSCKHLFLIFAAILLWTPCLIGLELCKCCFCASCTE